MKLMGRKLNCVEKAAAAGGCRGRRAQGLLAGEQTVLASQ